MCGEFQYSFTHKQQLARTAYVLFPKTYCTCTNSNNARRDVQSSMMIRRHQAAPDTPKEQVRNSGLAFLR
jgi:hypothetical protein